MSAADAHVVSQAFEPAPPRPFRMDHHYLLHARSGSMRLEADGRIWTLPPARAALIAGGHEVEVSLTRRIVARSALFAPGFAQAPDRPLSVFEMSPLAKELLGAVAGVGVHDALDDYARAIFRALVEETWRLARSPSPTDMPVGRTACVRRALSLTEERLADDLTLGEFADVLAVTPRTLSRRFDAELGMSWGSARRRLRMIRAIELLADGDASVAEVAIAVGYDSVSAFNAAFRDFTGETPTAFRAATAGDP